MTLDPRDQCEAKLPDGKRCPKPFVSDATGLCREHEIESGQKELFG